MTEDYTLRLAKSSALLRPPLAQHAAATNLLMRLRRLIAEPLPGLIRPVEAVSPVASQPGGAAPPTDKASVPAEARAGESGSVTFDGGGPTHPHHLAR